MKIAVLGAESTGKSQLAGELADAFRRHGKTVSLVDEYLREWCALHGRTPRATEQVLIAHTQGQRVEQTQQVNQAGAAVAAPNHVANHVANHVVVADTTALMTAVYSDLLFNDKSLYEFATAHQRSYDITLITGLDLPWIADGLQRDGPHTREPTDNLLRRALDRASLPYRVVYGRGAARLENALRAVHAMQSIANYSIRTWENDDFSPQTLPDANPPAKKPVWTWPCDKCSDPDCEHRLFSQLLR